ncbi:MAG: taurine--2-oxoglutarate transaminase [Bacteriovoracaceae bacterium]|jgi:taurine--2-oxoglutarate transaminase
MSDHPYYITWSKQKGASTYPLDKVEDHYFYSNGEKIADLSSISYQASFGLRPKFALEAVKQQLDQFSIVAPKTTHNLKTNVTKRLIELIDLDGGKIFYTTSGAEAVENALKMARLFSGKKTILARKPSYHGATLGAVSVTGDWRNDNVPTLDQWTLRIPEPHEDPGLIQTEKLFKETKDLAGIILETVPGNNGVLVPDLKWLQSIQRLCKEHKVLLILDEVICGFYRLGTAFGYQTYNLSPDIITMAKGITAGVIPFGAVWTNNEIHAHFNERVLSCGLTNYAHPLGLKALEAVLDYTEKKEFKDHLKKFIKVFNKDISSLRFKTRSIGLLGAIDLEKAPSFKECFDHGLSLVAQENRLILAPHLNLPLEQWDESFKKLEALLG